MERYEGFVRRHLHRWFEEARAVLGNDEDAALAAQFLCLEAYRRSEGRREEEAWRAP